MATSGDDGVGGEPEYYRLLVTGIPEQSNKEVGLYTHMCMSVDVDLGWCAMVHVHRILATQCSILLAVYSVQLLLRTRLQTFGEIVNVHTQGTTNAVVTLRYRHGKITCCT